MLEYSSPQSDPNFLMTLEGAGIEIGALGVAWGMRRQGVRARKALGSHPGRTATYGPSTSAYGDYHSKKGKIRSNFNKAKNLRGAALGMGYMGLALFGAEIGRGTVGAIRNLKKAHRVTSSMPVGYSDESYFDSRAAFTQRQRALQVIHNSLLSNRAAFGNEASFLHN